MLNGLTRALNVAASGMKAQDMRLLVISQNLSNAHVRPERPGELPYQRQMVTFLSQFDPAMGARRVSIKDVKLDLSPFPKVFSPSDPAADKKGYVLEPNVNPLIELADMRESSRSHTANVRVFEKVLRMMQNTLDILKA